jgi:hypothetical protein
MSVMPGAVTSGGVEVYFRRIEQLEVRDRTVQFFARAPAHKFRISPSSGRNCVFALEVRRSGYWGGFNSS